MRAYARSHLFTLSLAAALTAAHWPGITGAQDPGPRPALLPLRVGDTVRVWSKIPNFRAAVAEVSGLNADTLSLRVAPSRRLVAGTAAVAIPSLSRLDVQDGRRRSVGGIVGGAIMGMILGGAVGAGVGPLVECGGSCSGKGEMAGLGGFLGGAALGAVAGAIGGGILGGRKVPRWKRVALVER